MRLARYRAAAAAIAAAAVVAVGTAQHEPIGTEPGCQAVDAAWRRVDAPGPPARALHSAAFDGARGVAVVFGGVRADMTVLGDLWAFSPMSETWQEVIVPGEQPSARWASSAVTDMRRERILVLFGNDGRPSEEVWALDLGGPAWERLPAGPPARFDAAVAADGADRVWVYGGFPWSPALPDAILGDLWELDLSTNAWRQLLSSSIGSEHPPPTTNAALAFHAEALYLVGGHTASATTPGTWRFDLLSGEWRAVAASGAPAAWAHHARAQDAACGRLLLAGGDNADERDVPYLETLVLGATPRYARLPGEQPAVSRHHAALALDPASRQLVLFGGWRGNGEFLGDTWLYGLGAE